MKIKGLIAAALGFTADHKCMFRLNGRKMIRDQYGGFVMTLDFSCAKCHSTYIVTEEFWNAMMRGVWKRG